MRRFALARLGKAIDPGPKNPPTDREIARRAMVLSFGPRTAGWILKQHRKQLHAKGVIDFTVPEKPNKVTAEKLRWFFIAMDYLRQRDENGERFRTQWDVEIFEARRIRTFRVRWLSWRSWKRSNPFGPS